jgi:6-pyruvoyltetrahydropterin/6-carboxytetrahydropterin synthase
VISESKKGMAPYRTQAQKAAESSVYNSKRGTLKINRAGVVLDFITFKPLVKRVCDALDHRALVQSNSPTIEVHKGAKEVGILHKNQRLLLPQGDVILLPITNTSTELLAEYIAGQIRRKVRQNFRATIRCMKVAVEEARGQRGIFRDEF